MLPGHNPSSGKLYSGICNAIAWSQQVIALTQPGAAVAAKHSFVFNKPQSHSYLISFQSAHSSWNPGLRAAYEREIQEQVDR